MKPEEKANKKAERRGRVLVFGNIFWSCWIKYHLKVSLLTWNHSIGWTEKRKRLQWSSTPGAWGCLENKIRRALGQHCSGTGWAGGHPDSRIILVPGIEMSPEWRSSVQSNILILQ
ncbi:hCG2038659, isoform CRA_d [Homo sapiens]|uniref:AP20 region protein n=1 Tax=Homo sapiens TaxID=9606 RepID=Q8IVJ7_HUMAN|nr:hCG2038659, isoform CRA_d [Homo sapiens]CAD42704.1 AP20 region protein [Homo sapiens]